MEYRRLGKTGIRVSALSLGGWLTFGQSIRDIALARSIILKAYENGVNFFDCADIYANGESEKMMGQVFKALPRHHLVLSSKLYWPMSEEINDRGLSRKHIMESIDKSLLRMQTEYLDIYFCHRYDEEVEIEEVVRAMDDLVHRGKILYWGTSEWPGDKIEAAIAFAVAHNLYAPTVEQPQHNLLSRKRVVEEIAPLAQRNGLGLVTWSPLASGMLTGKYDDGIPADSRLAKEEWLREFLWQGDTIERCHKAKEVADKLGVSRAELAIAWVLQQPGVSSVITGATQSAQLATNLNSLELKLDASTLARLDEIFPLSASKSL
jgi:voltage-dependent potassium channel beta subunit